MKVKATAVVQYKGHSLSDSGSVNLTLKLKYDQLVNTVQLMQMLNNDIVIATKLPDGGAYKLGMFRLKSISIDGDGESIIKFNGLNDYVEVDNLNNIVTKDLFQARFVAEIESEEKNE